MKSLDTLISSTLFLMTRQIQTPTLDLEESIVDHLQMIACHKDCDSSVLKSAGQRLAMNWRQEARVKQLGVDKCPQDRSSLKLNSIH